MKRLALPDMIRGLLLIGMIGYHAMWDLVFLCGHNEFAWYTGLPGRIWQRTVCIGFIFLSGFCTVLGKRLLRRGITVSLAGILIMAVTAVFTPESRVVFGVLTMTGASMLITALLRKAFPLRPYGEGRHALGYALLVLILLTLFILLGGVPGGYIGPEGHPLFMLPRSLYRGYAAAFIGFMPDGFFSTDYFPLLPWYFLFAAGAAAGRLFRAKGWIYTKFMQAGIAPLAAVGKRSLLIYLLHQPVLYALFMLPVFR